MFVCWLNCRSVGRSVCLVFFLKSHRSYKSTCFIKCISRPAHFLATWCDWSHCCGSASTASTGPPSPTSPSSSGWSSTPATSAPSHRRRSLQVGRSQEPDIRRAARMSTRGVWARKIDCDFNSSVCQLFKKNYHKLYLDHWPEIWILFFNFDRK